MFLILHNEKQYINASLSGIYQDLGSCSVCQTLVDPIGIVILVDLTFPHKGCRDVPYMKEEDEIKCFSEAPKDNTVNSFILRKARLTALGC